LLNLDSATGSLALSLGQGIALGVAVLAVVWDVATRRIPNALTFGATVAAVAAHAYTGGLASAGVSLGGWLVGMAFLFPFFVLGGMGAGDVKLMGALGAWVGPGAVAWVALYTAIAGGVMGVVVAGFSGYLVRAFTNVWCILMDWRLHGPRPVSDLTLASHRGPRLAYAVPVLAGLVMMLWLR